MSDDYILRGDDERILGPAGGWVQKKLSFHSDQPPHSFMWRRGTSPRQWKIGIEFSRPWLLPFLLIFIPHRRVVDKPRWWSFRMGWRWDENWPGYIADVIIKFRIDNMVEKLTVLLLALLLTGCGAREVPPTVVTIKEPFEVKVPVAVRREPPPELLVRPMPPLPLFVAPTDPAASSALTADGERLLRALIEELLGRLEAWRAWAEAPD